MEKYIAPSFCHTDTMTRSHRISNTSTAFIAPEHPVNEKCLKLHSY